MWTLGAHWLRGVLWKRAGCNVLSNLFVVIEFCLEDRTTTGRSHYVPIAMLCCLCARKMYNNDIQRSKVIISCSSFRSFGIPRIRHTGPDDVRNYGLSAFRPLPIVFAISFDAKGRHFELYRAYSRNDNVIMAALLIWSFDLIFLFSFALHERKWTTDNSIFNWKVLLLQSIYIRNRWRWCGK